MGRQNAGPADVPSETLATDGETSTAAVEVDGHTPVPMRLFVGKLPEGVSQTELR